MLGGAFASAADLRPDVGASFAAMGKEDRGEGQKVIMLEPVILEQPLPSNQKIWVFRSTNGLRISKRHC
jgi:hypothetical protein